MSSYSNDYSSEDTLAKRDILAEMGFLDYYSDSESVEEGENPTDPFSWRWRNLDMDNWTDAEINEYTKNYVYFENKVVNALNEKFGIPLTWDYLPEEDEFSEESEDSWDEEYQDEAWTNYLQFKDLF